MSVVRVVLAPLLSQCRSVYKIHFTCMRLLGLGWLHLPSENNFNSFPLIYKYYSACSLFFWYILFLCCVWVDVPNHSFAELVGYLHLVFTFTISTIKIFAFMNRTQVFQRIIYTLEIEAVKRYHSKTIREKCRKQCIIFTMLFIIFSSATVTGYVTKGILDGLKRDHTDERCSLSSLPFPVRLPFCASSELVYALVFAYTMISYAWCGFSSLFIDLTVACIMLQLRAQLLVLCTALERLDLFAADRCRRSESGPDADIYTKDVDEIQSDTTLCSSLKRYCCRQDLREKMNFFRKKCIKEIIEQHIVVIECVELLENNYSIGFLIQIMVSLLALCFTFCAAATRKKDEDFSVVVRMCVLCVALLIQLGIQCLPADGIRQQGLELGRAAYSSHWGGTQVEGAPDREMRDLVLMIMIRSLRPLELSAAKFLILSNQSFLLIVRRAYSLFAFVQTIKRD